MKNKRLEELLEAAIEAKKKKVELANPELENKDLFPAEEHEQKEEVKEIVVEATKEAMVLKNDKTVLEERYVLKRPVGRPSNKSKLLDAKGETEVNSKGEVVYTKKKEGK